MSVVFVTGNFAVSSEAVELVAAEPALPLLSAGTEVLGSAGLRFRSLWLVSMPALEQEPEFSPEIFGIEQRTFQAMIIGSPVSIRIAQKLRAHAFHLGIKIVKIMQHQRFWKHGQAWGCRIRIFHDG